MAAGKRHVTIQGARGVFTWILCGAGNEPAEMLNFFDDIQGIEDMMINAGVDGVVVVPRHGTFTWWLRR